MYTPVVLALALVLLCTPPAAGQEEREALARVRLTTDPAVPVGCTRLAIVRDDSVKDLRRKVVKAGGDTALLSFPTDDLERIEAQVFRCPRIPPPPPGPPPPPPPGASPLPPPPPPR